MTLNELALYKNYVINTYFLKTLVKSDISLSEFILLLYFLNHENPSFIPSKITRETGLSKNDILLAFDGLVNKNFVNVKTSQSNDGKISEDIDLSGFYALVSDVSKVNCSDKFDDIGELKASLKSISGKEMSDEDMIIVNSWLEMGYSKSTIIDAFKDAKYNGISNLRYIDKVLSEWNEKGIKNISEANEYIQKNTNQKSANLFDYDWLNED